MKKNLKRLVLSLSVVISTSTFAITEAGWQLELGADSFSNSKSGGLASANFGSLGFEKQELDSSDTGLYFAARKNFLLTKDFFINTGVSFAMSSHDHIVNMRQINARVERESDIRKLSVEQRLGYIFRPYQSFQIRPFVGFGVTVQQTETTSSISNNGMTSAERPSSTLTDSYLYPSIGVEGVYANTYGVTLSYRSAQITTPEATIVTGNTSIEEGFDLVNIINLSFLYKF